MTEQSETTRSAARLSTAALAARFLVVGVGAAIVDIGLLAVLHDLLGVAVSIATPIAFLTAFVLTYVLQRTLTFRTRAAVASSFARYAILVAVNVLVTTAIVTGAVALGAPWILGKVAALAVTTVSNFFLYRHWVFPASPSAVPGRV